MKQLFAIKKFGQVFPEKLQTVAYRRKDKLYVQNLDYPNDRIKITHQSEFNKITIEVTLNEDEYFAVGNTDGIAAKTTIEG